MKKYLVVAWDQYHPHGGLDNIKASFDDNQDAQNRAISLAEDYDNVIIVNRDTLYEYRIK